MVAANQAFVEQDRREAMAERLGAVRYAADVRAYAAALAERATALPVARREQVLAWAAWAGTYADQIDPTITLPGMPATPKPTTDQLRPFLGSTSPYGPY